MKKHRTQNTERNQEPALRRIPCSAQQGFSLLELLIYIAILSGLMVVVSDSFISLSKARGQAQARNEVNASIRFATERIRQDLKGASVITTPLLGTPSATLQATVSGTTIIYDTLAGELRRKEGAGSPVLVSGTNVLVDTPTFTRIENYNTPLAATTTAIQVAMTFSYNASSTDWTYTDMLRTTVNLR
ncbi:MAG: prepilin-type N-terminal cleavage/methylation domain-containing protein [Candidatus Yonathbacteria bacterium]|nr:prepilin-type N-terminal cleavage/methylation domain-containing protein [Candidatus Yonathbacteria bacterium]